LYIEPGSPWENGYAESFQGKFRDELLDRELFYSVREAKVLAENWRLEYNHHRPHSSLSYKTPRTVRGGMYCLGFGYAFASAIQDRKRG
jgi:transposase InsO family protein